ncbi:TRAM domain-containing protein [Candidatus Woesearchaeota archaeon]|nr:TRAM domain-containing protein [Candidatus Woesearchaeota archaeon]
MYRVPVRVGEELDVTIEAVGEKGDGIAKKNGFILFVPGVKQGNRVRIKITKVLKKVGFAEVVPGETAPEKVEQASEQAPVEETVPEPEPAPEDTEDFGDEESAVDEQVEKESSEEVQEEKSEDKESADAVEESTE